MCGGVLTAHLWTRTQLGPRVSRRSTTYRSTGLPPSHDGLDHVSVTLDSVRTTTSGAPGRKGTASASPTTPSMRSFHYLVGSLITSVCLFKFVLTIIGQEAFEKCWAHCHCQPPHAHSPDVATDAACASMSMTTPTTTTTTTTRDRGDRYGPMEWAQKQRNTEVGRDTVHG